jgi:SAM-dependent methyltransferase
MSSPGQATQEADGQIPIKAHVVAIGRALWPRIAAIPRLFRRLIYTWGGRYVVIPLVVLAIGRIIINLEPVVLPGCGTTDSPATHESAACEESKADVHDVTYDVLLFVLGLLAATGLARYGLREMFAHDRKIAHEAQRHPFLAKLGETRFEQTYRLLTGLANHSYVLPSSEAMHEWFAVFFTEAPGRYRGVDTHLPSDYLQRYKWYLEEHEESLKDRTEKGISRPLPDVRVLAVDKNALGRDYVDNERPYRDFVKWHTANGVDVYWIPREDVQRLCRKYRIGTSDVGLWEDYGVFFGNLADGGVELSMRFRGARKRDKLSYKEVTQFMDSVVKAATPLTEVPPDLDIFGGELAERWEDYVDPAAREAVLGPFMDSVLQDHPDVLDAAAGIGCESIYLLKAEGSPYSVLSNEVDGRFLAVATRRAEKSHVNISLRKYRWESLPSALEGNMRFNAVLVLGNSICMVLDEEHRKRCLRAFFDCLRPGGSLVIDERNFSYLLRARDAVLSDPLATLPFISVGDVMYHGQALKGLPTAISDTQITWSFCENDPPAHSSEDLLARRIVDADVQLYPFKHGELFQCLRDTGFQQIDVYADLEPVSTGRSDRSTMPSEEAIGNSDFVTYVARRSG